MTGSSLHKGEPLCKCHTGLSIFSLASCWEYFFKCEKYSSVVLGITSKKSLLALFGFVYINKLKDSGEPYLNHSSIDKPLPLDFEIFSPLLSRKSSYEKPDGGVLPRTFKILLDRITLSDKSLPDIS